MALISSSFQMVPISAMPNKSGSSAPTKQKQKQEKARNVRQRLLKLGVSDRGHGNGIQELEMVDEIQRLGIEHLFEEEIREAMERQYLRYSCNQLEDDNRLHSVALRFRLLRNQGYHVPPDVFNKFMNKQGKFKPSVSNNVQELMGLYEASQMSIQGEDILDEANAFTDTHLLQHHNSEILKLPYHKSLPIFSAMELLSTGQNTQGWRLELRELAKLDLDMAATNYKQEYLHFAGWWKEKGLAGELELVRNEPVKWYSWAVGAQPRPDLSEERLDVAKPTALLYVVDDLFDVYADIHHLSLFTHAINSWDLEAIKEVPEYMRSTWRTIFETTNEISHKIWVKHGFNPNTYLHQSWADFCNACLVEAKWNATGYCPTASEYLKIGTVTSGVPMILCHAFFLFAQTLDAQTLHLLNDHPKIISSVATILRLSDDLESAEDEGQNGYDGSYVKCYMKENKGVSVDAARGRVHWMISEAWKELNRECLHLHPHPFSSTHTFGRACLNSARMVTLMYGYEHGHLPGLDKFLMLLLNGS